MAKEIEGWRDKREWEINGNDQQFNAILNLSRSHDGWYCPHCKYKYSLTNVNCGEGVTNEQYFSLSEEYEKVKMNCDSCGEDYYVRCFVTKKFYSCEDTSFED